MRVVCRWSVLLAVLTFASSAGLAPQAAAEQRTSPPPDPFRAVAREQTPIVVAIKTTTWLDPEATEDMDWYERFFGRAFPRGPQLRREAASGILISPDGDILTNDHVVADAEIIEVRLLGQDTTPYRATIVGRDPVSDTAVIKLIGGPSNLPVAALGDSDSLETGEWVMAIGNPYQLGHSVTVGVVSYVGRSFEIGEGLWQKLIQTDASINPGNSGGPLLNARGEVIGISLATLADGLGDTMGIGFAIPINSVKAVLPALRAGRLVRGSIGVRLRHASLTDSDAQALGLPNPRGALITSVIRGSSADSAGLRPGDVIVEYFGAPVTAADDVLTRASSAAPGVGARVIVIRDGRPQAMNVTVEPLLRPKSLRPHHASEDPLRFGLRLGDLDTRQRAGAEGSIVEHVEDGSVAEMAGIEAGDIICKINQHMVRTAAEAIGELQHLQLGRTVFLLIWRDGEERIVEMNTE